MLLLGSASNAAFDWAICSRISASDVCSCQSQAWWYDRHTYVLAFQLLTTQVLQQIDDLVRGPDFAVCEDELVLGPRIDDDFGNVFPYVSKIGESRWRVSVDDGKVHEDSSRIVYLSGTTDDLVSGASVNLVLPGRCAYGSLGYAI